MQQHQQAQYSMSKNWFAGLATRPHLGRCIVMKVAEGSPAAVAGIRVGDEITEVDYCPVTPQNVIQKYQEVREAPGPQVVFTVKRQDSGVVEEIVVERQLMNSRFSSDLKHLSDFDCGKRDVAIPPWRLAVRSLQDKRTHCFIVTVDVGFQISDFPEMISSMKKATNSWYTGNLSFEELFNPGAYEENTAHCIIARAIAATDAGTPRVAAAMLLGPLTPTALQPFNWETASVRVTRDTTWQDVDITEILNGVALRPRDTATRVPVSPLSLSAAIASALQQKSGGQVTATPDLGRSPKKTASAQSITKLLFDQLK